MEPQSELMTKVKFAEHMGVTRSTVSQWIKRGTITSDALSGEGRKSKIIIARAMEQVRRNRDIGQALGNGIETRTSIDAGASPAKPSASVQIEPVEFQSEVLKPQLVKPDVEQPAAEPIPPKVDRVEDQLKVAKLEEQLRRNRIQASEEALRQGLLMSAEDAREQMSRIATLMVQIFEGAMPDFAAAMAAQFSVPQRDVLHLLRAEFKKIRKTAANKEKARADDVKSETTTLVKP